MPYIDQSIPVLTVLWLICILC